ncbi:MAG TPA: hypothetical protein VLA55_04530 [Ornithinibacter sp.]|nr:hypothetical protein [Ornithinibacter sp.]
MSAASSTTTARAAGGISSAAMLAAAARAEWARIWSVRSSWAIALITAGAVVGVGVIIGLEASGDPSGPPAGATAWEGARPGAMFALFGLLALTVVATTADHVTGAIVPTLQWTPRRGLLLAARAGVVTVTATLLAVLLVATSGVVIRAFVPTIGLPAGAGLTFIGGLALVYACCALLAVGLGLTLRSTAGGLVTVIALVLVLPPLLANMPYVWAVELSALLPGSNALFLIFGEGPKDDMTVASSRLVLAAWGAVALLAGGWRLVRADANR